jgi:SAM-dependent methyltransferase
MSFDILARDSERYYSGKFAEHGATPQGVDWNSLEAQTLRFDQLLRVVDAPSRRFTINDYGCGYGALADHLKAGGYRFGYRGYDLSESMIRHARLTHPKTHRWVTSESDLEPADYTVASGLLNVKQQHSDAGWTEYCLDVIGRLDRLSDRGFAFNMLTAYSDPEKRRDDLYYGDPLFYFDHCKRHLSRDVALLHDYGLYEFTLIVRKRRP